MNPLNPAAHPYHYNRAPQQIELAHQNQKQVAENMFVMGYFEHVEGAFCVPSPFIPHLAVALPEEAAAAVAAEEPVDPLTVVYSKLIRLFLNIGGI